MQQLSGRALEAEGPGHEPRRRDELQFDAVLGAEAGQDDMFQRAHLLELSNVKLSGSLHSGVPERTAASCLYPHMCYRGWCCSAERACLTRLRCEVGTQYLLSHSKVMGVSCMWLQWWACRLWSTA